MTLYDTENNKNPIRYFLYARKSTESEDKQVQSIEDQIEIMSELARDRGFKIVKVFNEARSAKMPGNRPEFVAMLERIASGDADGILCWHLNRLARNLKEGGAIGQLLVDGIIREIHTYGGIFRSNDNILPFMVEIGQANQYIRDLSRDTKRGLNKKVRDGGWPGFAPVGYLNDVYKHTVYPDPDRFPLLRNAWDLMLTGGHNVPSILNKLNKEWGFRSAKKKHNGGKQLAMSGLYRVFTNPFYMGIVVHKGQEYKGIHKPMVSALEFDKVQYLLGKKSKGRFRKHHFAFTGFIHCGECGCLITAQKKHKHIKSTGEIRFYTYYGCTRKKPNYQCTQRTAVREDNLEEQIIQLLDGITILPEFHQWALEILRKSNEQEVETRNKIVESQERDLSRTRNEMDNLVKMRLREQVDDETYLKHKTQLQTKINDLQRMLQRTSERAKRWIETTERVFAFAANARQRFITGSVEEKKSILMALGQNPTMINGKLAIKPYKWLQPIADQYPAIEKKYLTSEPRKSSVNSTQAGPFGSASVLWGP